MNFFDMIRSIFQVKVVGKGRLQCGHWYPAPHYWVWKWKYVE